jgi:hypothetical protein
VTIVFGGRTQTATLGDTYELSGDEWIQTVASGDGPPARAHAAMAYDATRNVTVLFGGQPDPVEPEASANQLADTWEYATIDLSCTTGAECDTGFCVDGACCDVASCGVCESCATNEAPGSCSPVSGTDPDSCADSCENGACGKPLGATCTQGTECLGGICSNGYCCSTDCAGPCERCGTGACVPEPDGTASGACATTLCDRDDRRLRSRARLRLDLQSVREALRLPVRGWHGVPRRHVQRGPVLPHDVRRSL